MPYTSSPPVDLKLKSSELPPVCTAPLCAPADGRLVQSGKVITLRLVRLRAGEFVIYARWDGRNALVLRNGVPQIWKGKPTPQKLRAIAGHFARDNSWKFASVHIIPGSQNGHAIMALNRSLHPFNSYPTDYALTDSHLQNLIHFQADVDRNQSEFDDIMTHIQTMGSFANFAWQWLRSTLNKRNEIWETEIAKRGELEEIMTWIVWSLTEIWQQTDKVRIQCYYEDWQSNWFENADPRASNYLPLSPVAQRWIGQWSALLACQFQPTNLRHLQPYTESQSDYHLPFEKVFIGTPTAHEKIEARSQLRDWLQINAPKQLNELLPT